MAAKDLVVVGEVVKPHGIRGEFSVINHADSPSLYAPGRSLWLRAPKGAERVVEILASRPHQGRMLVTVKGVADRDAAEALRGCEVLVRTRDLPELEDDEIYLHEIVGFDVVLADGAAVGVLESFLDLPGQDVWLIRGEGGREILLPATEETVPEIDAEARRIVIDPPPGLLELSQPGE